MNDIKLKRAIILDSDEHSYIYLEFIKLFPISLGHGIKRERMNRFFFVVFVIIVRRTILGKK